MVSELIESMALTFSGRLLAAAISLIGKADVFVAKMQCGGTTYGRTKGKQHTI